MRATWSSIYLEVLIQKKENAFAEWRILIDELLETHKDYSTQPDDIKRLILGVPLRLCASAHDCWRPERKGCEKKSAG